MISNLRSVGPVRDDLAVFVGHVDNNLKSLHSSQQCRETRWCGAGCVVVVVFDINPALDTSLKKKKSLKRIFSACSE